MKNPREKKIKGILQPNQERIRRLAKKHKYRNQETSSIKQININEVNKGVPQKKKTFS